MRGRRKESKIEMNKERKAGRKIKKERKRRTWRKRGMKQEKGKKMSKIGWKERRKQTEFKAGGVEKTYIRK